LYFTLSDRYDMDRTLLRITALPRGDRWTALARQALRSDLYQAIASLTSTVIESTDASHSTRQAHPAVGGSQCRGRRPRPQHPR
jgi:NAD-specific glutamate dehydrogenase